jgi:DNA primase
MKDAQNDPIKKADLIREMVQSISKIPDRIQREIYTQECSRIMDISEQVLVSTLAQLVQKDIAEVGKKQKQEQKAFEVVKNEAPVQAQKIDILYHLERKIIEILLLYGNKMEEFEDVLLKTNADGEIEQVVEKKEYKVYQRIFLSLQEDEVELANPLFRAIFNDLINYYLQNEDFGIENYLKHLPDQFAQEVTDILMEDERVTLHKWDDQNIFVKQKSETVSQHTSEIIISMREYLINKLILDLMSEFVEKPVSDQEELKVLINDYNKLKVNLTGTIGRIRSTYI